MQEMREIFYADHLRQHETFAKKLEIKGASAYKKMLRLCPRIVCVVSSIVSPDVLDLSLSIPPFDICI